jgi:hypothetical protein
LIIKSNWTLSTEAKKAKRTELSLKSVMKPSGNEFYSTSSSHFFGNTVLNAV